MFDLAEWTVAAPDCSDASTNNCDSPCGPYPDPAFTCPLVPPARAALATPPALIIKGVLDLQTPQRGYSGKAVELLALEDVPGPARERGPWGLIQGLNRSTHCGISL